MGDQIIKEETILDKTFEAGSGFGKLGDPNQFQMPSIETVMQMIDQMDDISEEERENLKSNLLFPSEENAEKLRQQFEGAASYVAHSSSDYILFMAMLGLIVLVFALFGYKLYKSLMEKELKKQEKQKNNKKSKKIKQK